MAKRIFLTAYVALAVFSIIACSSPRRSVLPPSITAASSNKRTPTPAPTATATPTIKPSSGPGVAMDLHGTNDPEARNCPPRPALCYLFAPGDVLKTTIVISGVQNTVYCGLNSFCCPNPIPTVTFPTSPQLLSGSTESYSPSSYTPQQCGPWVTRTTLTSTWAPPSPWPTPGAVPPAGDWGANDGCVACGATFAGPTYSFFGRFNSPHPAQTPQPNPTPGVDIFDFNLSAVVTGTTQNVIVGSQQSLGAVEAQPGETLSNCNWTIGGAVVGGYDASGVPASPAPLANAKETKFYWLGSGSNVASTPYIVTVACVDQSLNNVNASATYTVNQPTVTISATYATRTGAPSAPTTEPTPCATPTPTASGQWSNGALLSNYNSVWPCGDWSENYGNPELDNFLPGISWTYIANIPQGGAGTIAMIQTKNTSRTGTTTSGTPWDSATNTNNAWCIDSTNGLSLYNGQGLAVTAGINTLNQQNDSPGQDLTTSSLSSISQNLRYTDYFMYQPTNGIYVALGTMSWAVNMNAVQQNGTWTFSSATSTTSPAQATVSNALPTWTC